jgi:hypothetical protein
MPHKRRATTPAPTHGRQPSLVYDMLDPHVSSSGTRNQTL